MEEEKATAYYNELLRAGRNAALFKQGLGFASAPSEAPGEKLKPISFVGAKGTGSPTGAKTETRADLKDEERQVFYVDTEGLH